MKPEWCPQWATDEATRVYHSLENSHALNEDAIARALLEAHQRGLQRAVDWHRKNARICREIAQDDPRINEADRKRAGQAAIQHDASATGIEAMMIEDRRAKAQPNA